MNRQILDSLKQKNSRIAENRKMICLFLHISSLKWQQIFWLKASHRDLNSERQTSLHQHTVGYKPDCGWDPPGCVCMTNAEEGLGWHLQEASEFQWQVEKEEPRVSHGRTGQTHTGTMGKPQHMRFMCKTMQCWVPHKQRSYLDEN